MRFFLLLFISIFFTFAHNLWTSKSIILNIFINQKLTRLKEMILSNGNKLASFVNFDIISKTL